MFIYKVRTPLQRIKNKGSNRTNFLFDHYFLKSLNKNFLKANLPEIYCDTEKTFDPLVSFPLLKRKTNP